MISPSYLRTFGIPLLAGRSFEDGDNGTSEPVVLVSRTLARKFWDVGAAVGQMVAMDDSDETRRARVVGVVGDVKHYGLDADTTPDIYVPVPQVPDLTIQWLTNNMYWGIRASTDPALLREAVRRELRGVDPDVPASAMRTMDEALSLALAPRRVNLWMVRAFAMIALLLAAAGVYAVTAFSVTLRARELAIRAALGAPHGHNLRSVLVDAARPIGAGLIAGAALALAAVPVLGAVLFGSWRYALRARLVKDDTTVDMRSAVERRIVIAQALYALGALLCVVNTYWSIAFIVLVQLNYVLAPRFHPAFRR